MELTKVAIGIQARTQSERLPNKVNKKISGKKLINYVADQVIKTVRYVNRNTHKHGIKVDGFLLIPEGDHIESPSGMLKILEGPEQDVLSRYCLLTELGYNYIVRITSDCPMVPSALINKAINVATQGEFDFVSNATPNIRTFWDGSDVEVVSKRALKYLDAAVDDIELREHVTLALHDNVPKWLKKAMIFSNVDFSEIKLSIDTDDDFQRVERIINQVRSKVAAWENVYGANCTFRF